MDKNYIQFCVDMLDRRTNNVCSMACHLRDVYTVIDKDDMCYQLNELMQCVYSLVRGYETIANVNLNKWIKGYRYNKKEVN